MVHAGFASFLRSVVWVGFANRVVTSILGSEGALRTGAGCSKLRIFSLVSGALFQSHALQIAINQIPSLDFRIFTIMTGTKSINIAFDLTYAHTGRISFWGVCQQVTSLQAAVKVPTVQYHVHEDRILLDAFSTRDP